jgi:hypothetical protein
VQQRAGSVPGRPDVAGFGYQVSGPPVGVLTPGPVWHASVSSRLAGRLLIQQRAYAELDGLGDPALGEWSEYSPDARVFHLRRRLTDAEAVPIGPVRDVRGTPEAHRRLRAMPRKLLRLAPLEALAEEAGPGFRP